MSEQAPEQSEPLQPGDGFVVELMQVDLLQKIASLQNGPTPGPDAYRTLPIGEGHYERDPVVKDIAVSLVSRTDNDRTPRFTIDIGIYTNAYFRRKDNNNGYLSAEEVGAIAMRMNEHGIETKVELRDDGSRCLRAKLQSTQLIISLGHQSLEAAIAAWEQGGNHGKKPEVNDYISAVLENKEGVWPDHDARAYPPVETFATEVPAAAQALQEFFRSVAEIKKSKASSNTLIIKPPVMTGDYIERLQSLQTSRETPAEDIEVKAITFSDIGGQDYAVRECKKIVAAINNPDMLKRRGAHIPKGILFEGPPGTGKTLLAKALANEANAEFIYVQASDIYIKWYGESANNMQKVFDRASEITAQGRKVIIFIDEIDAITPSRDRDIDNEDNKVISVILQGLSGFKSNPDLIFIAATNKPQNVDEGIMRSGRIDKIIQVGLPAPDGLEKIFTIHAQRIRAQASEPDSIFSGEIDWKSVAQHAFERQYSGADVENALNRLDEEKAYAEAVEGVAWSPITTDELIKAIDLYIPERDEKQKIRLGYPLPPAAKI